MRIGIDAGGTFTDFIIFRDDRAIETFKLRSNPKSPASVILAGLAQAAADRDAQVVHGSTVATNALLERKGARTAFVTTAGFEDVIHIGRQNRAELYNLIAPASTADYSARHVFRSTRTGVLRRHHRAIADRRRNCAPQDPAGGVRASESIAVCFLHAYRNPANERRVANALKGLGYLCTSHDVCPEFREYERSSTTLINAATSAR